MDDRAVAGFASAGPGTITRVVCEHGSPKVMTSARGSTVECTGPSGSTTTTSVSCDSAQAKSVAGPDRIVIFCPEAPPRKLALPNPSGPPLLD